MLWSENDNRVKSEQFEIGQQVFVLLSDTTIKLLNRWQDRRHPEILGPVILFGSDRTRPKSVVACLGLVMHV